MYMTRSISGERVEKQLVLRRSSRFRECRERVAGERKSREVCGVQSAVNVEGESWNWSDNGSFACGVGEFIEVHLSFTRRWDVEVWRTAYSVRRVKVTGNVNCIRRTTSKLLR
jgi:hypothetical protein